MITDYVKKQYVLPETPGVMAFDFSLDGGGRPMIIDAILKNNLVTMIEVGCFLCGSTKLWLENCPGLEVIGIDPWAGEWHKNLEHYNRTVSKPWRNITNREAVISSVRNNGPFISAMANVQKYRGRFFPVRGKSPDKLYEMEKLGAIPDIVYFDSNKRLDDLDVAYSLWPNATLCGDDWSWGEDKDFPVKRLVHAFCEKHGFKVQARGATWLINKD